jgi:hypothetical protein
MLGQHPGWNLHQMCVHQDVLLAWHMHGGWFFMMLRSIGEPDRLLCKGATIGCSHDGCGAHCVLHLRSRCAKLLC